MNKPSARPSAPGSRRGDPLLLRHTASGVLRMGIQLASMMILVPVILSRLGEDRFGIWTLGMALVGGLTLLEMGLLQSANRFLSTLDSDADPNLFQETACTSFWLTLPSCAIILLVALPMVGRIVGWLGIQHELSYEAGRMVRLLVIHAALSIPLRGFPGLLVSQRRMSRVHLVQGVASLLVFIFSWMALLAGAGLEGLAIVYLGCMLLEHAAYVVLSTRLLPLSAFRLSNFRRAQLPRLTEFALFAWIGQVANVIFLRLSVFLVQGVSGVAATGAYSVASRLANISLDLSNQAVAAGGPKVAALANQETRRQEAGWLTMGLVRRSILFSGPLAVVALTLGYPFLYGWVGPKIAAIAELPLVLLVVDVVASMPMLAFKNSLAIGGQHRYANIFSILMGAMFLPAAWLLGRAFNGPTGVALATLLLTLLVGLPVLSNRFALHFGVRMSASWRLIAWPHLIPAVIATSIGLVARFLIHERIEPGRPWLWASAGAAVLSAGAYILLYAFRFAPREEREAFRRLLGRGRPQTGAEMVPLAGEESWDSIKTRVQAFENRCDGGLYLGWSYSRVAWKRREKGGIAWLVTLGCPTDPVGLVIMEEKLIKYAGHVVRFLHSLDHHVMRTRPCLAPLGFEAAAIEALVAARASLHNVTGASIMSLTKLLVPDAEVIQAVLRRSRIPCRLEGMGISYEIELGQDMADYWNGKKRKSLYNLRRSGRLLEEQMGPLIVDRVRGVSWSDPVLRACWDDFVALRRRSWQFHDASRREPGEAETMLSFDEAAVRDWADKGYLEIALLKANGKAVAGVACCTTGSVTWVVIQAFDESLASFSPGRILFARLIDQVHAEGIRRLVLGPTDDDGKRFWANRMERLIKITFPLGGWIGAMWSLRQFLRRLGSIASTRREHPEGSGKSGENLP